MDFLAFFNAIAAVRCRVISLARMGHVAGGVRCGGVAQRLRAGYATLGQRAASAVNASADTIYVRWRRNHGKRQASYAMQISRLVWNWAVRHHDVTGVTVNPFRRMGINSTTGEGNRETSRDEYNLYRDTVREMGY